MSFLAGTLIAVSALTAQDSLQPKVERTVIQRFAPAYPDLARKMRIAGVVKLVAIVAPNGSVKAVEVVGGNPLLITPAQNAVKEWKYAPAANETRELVVLRFSQH